MQFSRKTISIVIKCFFDSLCLPTARRELFIKHLRDYLTRRLMAEKCKFKHVNLEVTRQICQTYFCVFVFRLNLRAGRKQRMLDGLIVRLWIANTRGRPECFRGAFRHSQSSIASGFIIKLRPFCCFFFFARMFCEFATFETFIGPTPASPRRRSLWGFLRSTEHPRVLRLEKNHPSFNSLIALKLNRLSKEADYGFCLLSFTKDRKGLRGRARNFIRFKLRKAGRRFYGILLNIKCLLVRCDVTFRLCFLISTYQLERKLC